MFISSALYSLEDDWTDIVEGHANLSEQLKYSITPTLHFCFFSPLFTFTFLKSIFPFHFHFHLQLKSLQESTDCLVGVDIYRACLHKNSQSDSGCEFKYENENSKVIILCWDLKFSILNPPPIKHFTSCSWTPCATSRTASFSVK